MESLKVNNLSKKHNPGKIALLQGSEHEITKIVTFKSVFDTAKEISAFLSRNIDKKHTCVALLMDKNALLPSVIISLQELNFSFVCLTPKTLADSVRHLNIKWVLSLDDETLSADFHLKESLQLTVGKKLHLWMTECLNEMVYQDVFCVVQTSGSTGESKVVYIPHTCIEKNVISLNKYFNVSSDDIVYWGTPLTFDPTLIELLLGLVCGATLFIIPPALAVNPSLLYHALFKIGRITFLQIVPSMFLRWSKQHISEILLNSSLRTLCFGGEAFPPEVLSYKKQAELKLFNLYGVTELSCWATVADLTFNASAMEVPLGKTLDETFVHIENDGGEIVSDEAGEICIGSYTRYCWLDDHTKKPNLPFIVKTGDLGEYKNGNLYYRGRKTRVIKRFGHRVTLQKIEDIIFSETGLRSRIAYSNRHKKLLAFILIENHYEHSTKIRLLDKLRVKLLNILPEYAFPDFLDILTSLPLSAHGKICDKSLEKRYQESLNENLVGRSVGQMFVDILSGYLKTDIGGHINELGKHSFIELGGNSLLALQFLQAFEAQIGSDVPGELIALLLNESIQTCTDYAVQNIKYAKRVAVDGDKVSGGREVKMLKNEATQTSCVLWKYDLKGCVDSSPIVFNRGGSIYVAVGSFAHIFTVISENGLEYLNLSLTQEIEARPAISTCGNFIFVGCGNGSMYSIDLVSKTVAWEYSALQKIRSSACMWEKSVIFGSYDGFVYSVAQKDGMLQWKTELTGGVRADLICSSDTKRIYVGTIKGMCYSLNGGDGSIVWTNKVDGPVFGSPCILGQCTVWSSVIGKIYCFSATGDVSWSVKIDGNIFSSLIARNNMIYFGSGDSHLYRIQLSDSGFENITKIIKMESESASSPFLHEYEGKLFLTCVCNIGVLYVIDISSESVVFEMQLSAQSFSSPYVFKNKVYLGCRDDNLYSISIDEALINAS